MNTRYEILPDIYIGFKETVGNKMANEICKIKHIIDVEHEFSFINTSKAYREGATKKNIEKYELDKSVEVLVKCTNKLNTNVKNNEATLLVCNTVQQFSPSVVTAYMMIYGKLSLLDSVKIVKSKKENVFNGGLLLTTALSRISSRV
jgi:hypothetical protein